MRLNHLSILFFGLIVALFLASCNQESSVVEQATAVSPSTTVAIAQETPAPTAVPPTATPPPAASVATEAVAVPAPAEPESTVTPEESVGTLQPLTDPMPAAPLAVRLTPVADGFTAPVAMVAPNDESRRLFVADQTGLIYIVTIRPRVLEEPFLDISERLISLLPENETRGLLGLALHPNYAENGRFFVHYSAPLRPDGPEGWDHTSQIAEFTAVRPISDLANPDSERLILQIDQPMPIHNGGQIAFGPDGYLYISLGDGGVSENAQDTSTLLGSILRIDVDAADAPYAIPADNPFVGHPGLDEIFAYGFRNPAHITFDSQGRLLVTDSGQASWQEVNTVVAGGNYGWPLLDGGECTDQAEVGLQLAGPLPAGSSSANCGLGESVPLATPVVVYAQNNMPDGLGTAVVGGAIYRGRAIPTFQEHYIFGNSGQSPEEAGGRLFIAPPPLTEQTSWDVQELVILDGENGRLTDYLRAIAYDVAGEIYLLTSQQPGPTGRSGALYRLGPEIMAKPQLVEDAADYFPLPQQYARIFERVPVYRTAEDAAANNPFGTHGEGHTWVTVFEEVELNGRKFRRVFWDWGTYAWVESKALHFTSPMSRLQGLQLEPGALTVQQLAMAYRPVWVRSEPGVMVDETIAGYLEPWDLITIYEETEVDGDIWYRLGPDQWVNWDYVRLFYETERPAEIGPDDKWVHINLSEQTVVAYEGDTAVYASLAATGRRAYPTFTGLYRIYAKLRVGPMRWQDSIPPYSLANVPWIMYFNQDQALHGSYWHDLFGSVRSAGCVNLSPHDANWFFNWADPFFEEGARIADATDENPGTWVFVEE